MGTDHDVAQKKVSALTAAEPIVSRAKHMHVDAGGYRRS